MTKSNNSKQKFFVCIEGEELEWNDNTITAEQIVDLGGWDVSQGVIEVDKNNNERTLAPGEIVEIKPGHGFGKKICWKRGLLNADRIQEELSLLKQYYRKVEYIAAEGMHWFLVEPITLLDCWTPSNIPVVFYITEGHPGTQPYGFFVPVNTVFNGKPPKSASAKFQPPFPEGWCFISWQPEQWHPTDNVRTGDNLWGWTRGFKHGLES